MAPGSFRPARHGPAVFVVKMSKFCRALCRVKLRTLPLPPLLSRLVPFTFWATLFDPRKRRIPAALCSCSRVSSPGTEKGNTASYFLTSRAIRR